MKVIGLVLLCFVFGESSQYLTAKNENLYTFTTEKITGYESKTDGPIQDKCGLKLVQEAAHEFGSTYMFITDDRYHVQLLQNLQIRFLHSYFTEPSQLSYSRTETFDNLLIFHNKFKLREVIKKKKPFQGTKFFIHVRNYDEAIVKFKILWENRLVNAVASYVENSTVYYYTYFPYSASHCGEVGKPHLLARCDISNGVFSHREKLFPRKVRNIHKCPINVTLSERIPSSYYDEKKQLTGWEVELINEILERINGVPNYKMLMLRRRTYEADQGYRLLVENSEIGAGLVVSLRGLTKTDFCMYGMSFCTTWIEPRNEVPPLSFDFLTKVFPPAVWVLLLIAYVVMATTIRVFYRIKYWNILYKLLPFLLGTTTRTKKISKPLGALWLWFCLLMNAIYQSGFQSILLVPSQPNQLGSTKEVLQSNLKILGVSDVIVDMIPYFRERYNLSSRRIKNRKLSHEDWVYRMIVKKDSVYLGYKEIVRYNTERNGLANQIYISDYCVVKYLLAFVLKKNSHLTETILKFSNRLNENGFLEFFVRKHLWKKSRPTISKKLMSIVKPIPSIEFSDVPLPINMDKLFVIFMCLGGGLLLSLVAFAIELVSTWDWKLIKKKTLREIQSACPCKN